jgi:hypothetical protein
MTSPVRAQFTGPDPFDPLEDGDYLLQRFARLERFVTLAAPDTAERVLEAEDFLREMHYELLEFFNERGTCDRDLEQAYERAKNLLEKSYDVVRRAELSDAVRTDITEQLKLWLNGAALLDETPMLAALVFEEYTPYSPFELPMILRQYLVVGDMRPATVVVIPAWMLGVLKDRYYNQFHVVGPRDLYSAAQIETAHQLWDPVNETSEFEMFEAAMDAARALV